MSLPKEIYPDVSILFYGETVPKTIHNHDLLRLVCKYKNSAKYYNRKPDKERLERFELLEKELKTELLRFTNENRI